MTLRATGGAIEIYDKNHIRIASYRRRYSGGRYVTDMAHMPPNHRAVHEARQFDGSRYRAWAGKIGGSTQYVIDRLLRTGAVEEQGYKACMGVLQFSKAYGDAALENACERACAIGSPTYTTVKRMLKSNLKDGIDIALPAHENIRGSAYYR